MKAFFLLLTFLPSISFAAALHCVAPFDEGSRYELGLRFDSTGVTGPAELRYLTDDGLDLRAALPVRTFYRAPGRLMLDAANDSMGAALAVQGDEANLGGTLTVSFSLDDAEALELPVKCELR